jgi:hypothetical protein
VKARAAGDQERARVEFQEALYAVDEAFEEIEPRGKFNFSIFGAVDQATKDQAVALADWWGIRGGILREHKEIEKSIDAYDTGYELEANPTFEINSTYNTVNRLVLRLLTKPELLKPDAPPLPSNSGPKVISQLLAEASIAIYKKWKLMNDPVWALADMVLIKTLLEHPDVAEWETILKETAKEQFPFDSLAALVGTLAKCGLPATPALNQLAARLNAHVAEKWPPTPMASQVG